ncbi:hypothetical protein HOY82DRAFT_477380 [Tuber indicum]|nr:hypothetical protein HOY82DRAFT_477380 [Tuber indicum]
MLAAMMARQQSDGTRHSEGGTSHWVSCFGTDTPVAIKQPSWKTQEGKRSSSDLPPNLARDVANYSSNIALGMLSSMVNSPTLLANTFQLPESAIDHLRDASKRFPKNTDARAVCCILENKKKWFSTALPGDYLATDHTLELNIIEESCWSTLESPSTPSTIASSPTTQSSPSSEPTSHSGRSSVNGGSSSRQPEPLLPPILQGPTSSSEFGSMGFSKLDADLQTLATSSWSTTGDDLTAWPSGFLFTPSPTGTGVRQKCLGAASTESEPSAMVAARNLFYNGASRTPPIYRNTNLDMLYGVDTPCNPSSYLFLFENAEGHYEEAVCPPCSCVNSISLASSPSCIMSPGATVIHSMGLELGQRELENLISEVPTGDCAATHTRPTSSQGVVPTARYARRMGDDSAAATGRPPTKKVKGPNGQAMPIRAGVDERRDGTDRTAKRTNEMTMEEHRKNYFQSKRPSAIKLGKRKRDVIASLRETVESFSRESAALEAQITTFQEVIIARQAEPHTSCESPVARFNVGNMHTMGVNPRISNPLRSAYEGVFGSPTI